MATILRDWSYRYPWLYNGISRVAALSVGGEARFRRLALVGLSFSTDVVGMILLREPGSGLTARCR